MRRSPNHIALILCLLFAVTACKKEEGLPEEIIIVFEKDCQPMANVPIYGADPNSELEYLAGYTNQDGEFEVDPGTYLQYYYLDSTHLAWIWLTTSERANAVRVKAIAHPRQTYAFRIVDTTPNLMLSHILWVECPFTIQGLFSNPRVEIDSPTYFFTPIDTIIYVEAFPCPTLVQTIRYAMDSTEIQTCTVFEELGISDGGLQCGPF